MGSDSVRRKLTFGEEKKEGNKKCKRKEIRKEKGKLILESFLPETLKSAKESLHIFLYYDSVDGYAVIVKNITVDQSGNGDFTTIQGAIDSIPYYNTQWIRIHVVAGIYSHSNSALAGGMEGATFSIFANNFVIRDIAFKRSTLHSIKEGSQPGWLTADGKTKPDAPGGFLFKYCTVDGGKTFLGRAWNSYSTVVFYDTYMADNVVPEGWDARKTGNNAYQTTYAEDGCSGPGSNTTNRVNWERKLSYRALKHYISNKFIDKEGWRSQQP
ncbi:putative pectinesterase 29 [Cocos nucifera]|uniref:pectinesterase n=1 Tax=Cocos nucifera TaxID=13894 RepID=A0A8K0NDS4_COCNU|nr:putative pectinesterase 29 [Cocos nucifera]